MTIRKTAQPFGVAQQSIVIDGSELTTKSIAESCGITQTRANERIYQYRAGKICIGRLLAQTNRRKFKAGVK